MARRKSYSELLRDARKRKRLDLTTAARRLRIRPDILQAIEEADFVRMPPRGYSRNMINAYARLLDLDPREIVSLYLDEVNSFEAGEETQASSSRGASNSSTRSHRFSMLEDDYDQTTRTPRTSRDMMPSTAADMASRSGDRTYTSSRSKRTSSNNRVGFDIMSMDNSRNDYGTGAKAYPHLYSSAQNNSPQRNYTPLLLLIGIIVVVLIVIIILVIAFGGNRTNAEDVPDVPISGLTDTSDTESEEGVGTTVEAEPTSATFVYEIADGQRSWCEIYIDGSDEAVVYGIVDGPYTSDPYIVTGTLLFRTANPDAVTLLVDGQRVYPVNDGTENYNYTVDFPAILQAWRDEHPELAEAETSTEEPIATE